MKNFVKTKFSIKDLENLSGIKAHTIRIWERRYNLLKPERTQTNIRFYSLVSLRKLLNIKLLYQSGVKISAIANFSEASLNEKCSHITQEKMLKSKTMHEMKLSMMAFDYQKFQSLYKKLRENQSFQDIFLDYFIPTLNDLGYLWQTGTINPSEEHFITSLIKQKVLIESDRLQIDMNISEKPIMVLFLPENEIHELGLLFINYFLLSQGYYTIYLGQSLPIDDLIKFSESNSQHVFVSNFTVSPTEKEIDGYLEEFSEKLLQGNSNKFCVFGNVKGCKNLKNKSNQIELYESYHDFIQKYSKISLSAI